MAKVCAICGKHPVVGNKVVQSGKAKREGGVGKKTTGITKEHRVKVRASSGDSPKCK